MILWSAHPWSLTAWKRRREWSKDTSPPHLPRHVCNLTSSRNDGASILHCVSGWLFPHVGCVSLVNLKPSPADFFFFFVPPAAGPRSCSSLLGEWLCLRCAGLISISSQWAAIKLDCGAVHQNSKICLHFCQFSTFLYEATDRLDGISEGVSTKLIVCSRSCWRPVPP